MIIYFFKYIIYIPTIFAIINFNNDFDPNNEIIGGPIIQCTPEKVKFSIETLKPFHGRIYVKGEFNKKNCGRSFSMLDDLYGYNYKEEIDDENSFLGTSKLLLKNHNRYEYQNINDIKNRQKYDKNEPLIFPKGNNINNPSYENYLMKSFGGTKECPIICPICDKCNCQGRGKRNTNNWNDLIIPINECFAKRDSQIETATEAVTFTVIVTFHKNFITKLDKSYQVICTYPEISKTVQTQINVSAPPPKDVSIVVNPPKCLYSLKNIHNILVKHVNIGDEIMHEWTCESQNTNMYSMIVKNCYVEDGSGRKELIIDERGCSLDNNVLKTPIYSPNKMKAYVKSNVFKFPDRQYIDFQCNIGICINSEQDCSNISPPKCDDSYKRYKRDIDNMTDLNNLNIHLHSQTLTVLETKKQSDIEEEESLKFMLNLPNTEIFSVQLCLSLLSYGILIASGTFVFTVLSMTIVVLKFFKYFI
ncbi:Zona pellucida domain-containing protein [Strongyloides ratti]|uniref:Zona pellucida domain-containing protein n=1 Tax=Strongyloides ratti TaxID=34506 RepID=A0A090LM03_STRRB|nr:Zona pellucida domain-containing protein [Strongyloides ratti]CEF70736.1 Zona pellucida domain-containing protein [Strongyloides ratti]